MLSLKEYVCILSLPDSSALHLLVDHNTVYQKWQACVAHKGGVCYTQQERGCTVKGDGERVACPSWVVWPRAPLCQLPRCIPHRGFFIVEE